LAGEWRLGHGWVALRCPKNATAATAVVVAAFKSCISHRKSGLLNHLW
jgi:hypothetical protein